MLEATILAYRDAPNEVNTTALWNVFFLLATNVVKSWSMESEARADMSVDATILMVAKCGRWEQGRGTAFNFFTSCCYNEMRQAWRKRLAYLNMLDELRAGKVRVNGRARKGNPHHG